MASYAWNGVCYETTAKALSAFALDVPSVDASGINAFASDPTITGSGLITWAISNRPFSAADATVRAGTTQLQACTYDSYADISQSDLVLTVAIVLCFLIGWRMGQAA